MFIHVLNKDDANLLEKRMSDDKVCIVLYYMDGCYFCENMKPEWTKFEKKYNNHKTCTVSKIEASNMDLLTKKPEITGYPTICKYVKGKREDFNADRNETEFSNFAEISIKPKKSKKSTKGKKKSTKGKKTKASKGKKKSAKGMEKKKKKKKSSKKKK
jgi:hypothetical protein